jgi:hypothetical protein
MAWNFYRNDCRIIGVHFAFCRDRNHRIVVDKKGERMQKRQWNALGFGFDGRMRISLFRK